MLELLALPVCHVILFDLLDEMSVSLIDVVDDEIHVVDSAVYSLAAVSYTHLTLPTIYSV